jgi:hypothetical protein
MYDRKPVHNKFTEWLDFTIINAANAMIEHLTISLTPDQLFDVVVPIEHHKVLLAASTLMPQMRSQIFHAKISNGMMDEYPTKEPSIPVMLVFKYSKPNHLLVPNILNWLRAYNTLADYLLPSFRIAREFSILRCVVKYLITITENRDMLSALFPWLPDLVIGSGWIPEPDVPDDYEHNMQWLKFYTDELNVRSITERAVVSRSFASAVKRGRGNRPLMHTEVIQALNLGTKLFTQYRLFKSQEQTNKQLGTCITPMLSDDLVPLSLTNALLETKAFYEHERDQWKIKNRIALP